MNVHIIMHTCMIGQLQTTSYVHIFSFLNKNESTRVHVCTHTYMRVCVCVCVPSAYTPGTNTSST